MVLLADPAAEPLRWPVLSVDDHLIEPADIFTSRVPAALQDLVPRIVEREDRSQAWLVEGNELPQIGLNAVVGRPKDEWSMDPVRFDEMRPGCFDPAARLLDMDACGIWASVCFPSLVAGFSGAAFSRMKDPVAGLASLRAWNAWMREEWAGAAPDRLIGLVLPWLQDVQLSCEEVRTAAAAGARVLSFPEFPVHLGLPSLHSRYWDPLWATCQECDVVVAVHTGSASWAPLPSYDGPFALFPSLFPVSSLLATIDWIWSGIATRFPRLRIAMAEGGVGWVPMLADRLDFVLDHSGSDTRGWKDSRKPSEVLAESYWFCTLDDRSSLAAVRDRVGLQQVCVEVDYPHADSLWPQVQSTLATVLAVLTPEEQQDVTWRNACRMLRWPEPSATWLQARR
jgi:predicted TIM-barrel fold metal-dependent hydrolase